MTLIIANYFFITSSLLQWNKTTHDTVLISENKSLAAFNNLTVLFFFSIPWGESPGKTRDAKFRIIRTIQNLNDIALWVAESSQRQSWHGTNDVNKLVQWIEFRNAIVFAPLIILKNKNNARENKTYFIFFKLDIDVL